MLVRRRAIIIFWTVFIGTGALIGSLMFFCDPQNGFVMGEILPIMRERLPFGDLLFGNFIFSGISLLIVNGISNLTACALIIKNKEVGYILGSVFGITLMMWISIQFYVFAPQVYTIDIVFFIFGLLQFLSGYAAYAAYRQNRFKFNISLYKNTGVDKKSAVVFFSRMGYVKRLAYEKADSLGCDIIELKTPEHTQGLTGFWWCGRFGMHKWGMKLLPLDKDIATYDKIYIFTPIWVFSVCSPIREFIKENAESIKSAEITSVHFMKSKLDFVFGEPRKLLGSKLKATDSLTCRFGRVKVRTR